MNTQPTDQSHNQCINQLIAGMFPNDSSVELFGESKTKMHFIQNGKTKRFKDLPRPIRASIEKKLLADKKAMKDLSGLTWSQALEEFAFCHFGAADNEADFTACGTKLNKENFRCSNNCRCLKWDSKNINYKGTQLTLRELQVIDEIRSGAPNKLSAYRMGISQSTFDTHKKNIMNKFKAANSIELILKAAESNII